MRHSSDRRAIHVAVSVVLIRVDRDRVVVRENMSDGTVRLTLARRSSLGLEAGVGGRLQVKLKGGTFGPAREARIGAQGVFGTGEVFVADSASEADEIVRRLLRPRVPGIDGLPGPREIFGEGGIRGLGRLGLGSGLAGASLDGTAEGILAVRRDQRSGDVTLSLNAAGSAWGLLNGLLVGHVAVDRSFRRARPEARSARSSDGPDAASLRHPRRGRVADAGAARPPGIRPDRRLGRQIERPALGDRGAPRSLGSGRRRSMVGVSPRSQRPGGDP